MDIQKGKRENEMRHHREHKIIVDRILGILPEVHLESLELDPVPMDHSQLQKPHQKAVSRGGRVLGISLDKGEQLYPLAVLFVDDQVVVFVEQAEEDLLELRPANALDWARAAYNIGNMHQPAYLAEDCIRVPYDPVLPRMLDQLGIPWTRRTAKLEGFRANAAYGHTHSHEGEAHAHSHNGEPHTHSHNGEPHAHSHEE